MQIMGLDIGGANTDLAVIELNEDKIKLLGTDKHYLPMWSDPSKLTEYLRQLGSMYSKCNTICVSMTAELADSYENKKQGVLDISGRVQEVFSDKDVYFVSFDGLIRYEDVIDDPLSVAAANWIGTVNCIKYISSDCIFMDMGSTTTDIIPLKDSKEICQGHTDLERLLSGELVYTGVLRTNLATITPTIPIRDNEATVSSELFSITADMNLVLGNITPEDYTCDTPDGSSKTKDASLERIARLVCADLDMLTRDEVISIARHVYNKQIEQVTNGLVQVVDKSNLSTVVITDMADTSVCYKATSSLGLDIINMNDYISPNVSSIITSLGAIQMYIDEVLQRKLSIIDQI
ncbi:MAG: H4MPT-linked C1 transfer pathway protein [Methanosphaera sp.]|nr:H4MPT-linked C1 transfer pathway protein [Methanosphaera sp.]